jgi:hypothetical protein
MLCRKWHQFADDLYKIYSTPGHIGCVSRAPSCSLVVAINPDIARAMKSNDGRPV